MQKFGWPYFLYKIRKKVFNFVSRLLVKAWHIHHPLAQNEFTIEALAKKGVCIYHTTDVHCEENLAFISASKPELGVIYGSRILQDKVLSIPTLGTINIHKSKVPDYRGGGKTGYWELLAKEKEIGVTIHYAVAKVDEGDVLDSTIVPVEPYDTLAPGRYHRNPSLRSAPPPYERNETHACDTGRKHTCNQKTWYSSLGSDNCA